MEHRTALYAVRSALAVAKQLAILLLLSCAVSCKSEQPSAHEAASCDSAAEHLIQVCSAPTGEGFRALCEIAELPRVTPGDRQCVASLSTCAKTALERCDVHDVIIPCDTDSDCPGPFLCDAENEECVRCKTDGDCASGRGCLMGLCYDKQSDFFKSWRMLSAPDADGGSD
jgi:hypothetical protein